MDMMLAAIREILSTVAVTSRSAYSFLSAGARFPVCPATAIPISFTISKNFDWSRDVERPGMASSLSRVPPVCPSPLPESFATGTPQAAATGPITMVVLSPTPPVECLSTLIPGMGDRSISSPDAAIQPVKKAVSCSFIP